MIYGSPPRPLHWTLRWSAAIETSLRSTACRSSLSEQVKLPFLFRPRSPFTPQPIDLTAIPLRWPAFQRRFEIWHCSSFFRQLDAQLPARFGFAVERLRNRRRAAHLTQGNDLHLKLAAVVLDLQQVAGA